MSLFDAIGGLGAIYGFDKGIKDVQGIGEQALTRAQTGATNLEAQTQFKPFTVTSGVGGAQFDQAGNLGLTMTPEQQAIQSQLQGFGSSMFDYLGNPAAREQEQGELIRMLTGGGVAGREADIMSRLQASVAPEQERARLQLEERLAGQGRLGVQTSMFGGTPEALALEKAIAEQNAGFGVSAMEQARAEQAQQSGQTLAGLQEMRNRSQLAGQTGLAALQSSYQPLESLLGTLTPALQAADIAGAGQRQGAQLGASMLQSGQQTQLGAEVAAANLQQQQIQAIANLLGGQQANTKTGQTAQTGLLESLFNRFTGNTNNTGNAETQAILDQIKNQEY
ncbi:hypothetical protein N9985_01950 [Gammaproteobacteria bacterium]|nr:hypothetical protein [Gammaproteobacteria bacterium]